MFSSLFKIVALVAFLSSVVFATADGPDNWDIKGVASNHVLNMLSESTYNSSKVCEIPHNGTCLTNLICSMPFSLARRRGSRSLPFRYTVELQRARIRHRSPGPMRPRYSRRNASQRALFLCHRTTKSGTTVLCTPSAC